MIIVIFPVIYFYAIVLAVVAVGVELAVFLQKWIVELSVVLWLFCAYKAVRSGLKTRDPESKIWLPCPSL